VLRHAGVSMLLLQRSLRSRDFLEELLEAHPELARAHRGRIFCPALSQLRQLAVTGRDGGAGGVARWEDLHALGEEVPDDLLAAATANVTPASHTLRAKRRRSQ
jgi:hypothetical protein